MSRQQSLGRYKKQWRLPHHFSIHYFFDLKIRNILHINTVVSIFLLCVMSVVVLRAFVRMAAERDAERGAYAIANEVAALRFTTFEYLVYGELGTRDRWQYVYEQVGTLLEHARQRANRSEKSGAHLGALQASYEQVQRDFSGLVSAEDNGPWDTGEPISIISEKEQHFISLLIANTESMSAGASALAELSRLEGLRVQKQTINILIFFVFLLGVCILAISFFFQHAIGSPLALLEADAVRIGEGNFGQRSSFKGNNEIGTLAGAFNDMSRRLERSYLGLAEAVEEKTQELANKIEELNSEKTRIETILASIQDGVIAIDRDGRIIQMNAMAASFAETSVLAAKGRLFHRVFHLRFEKDGTEMGDSLVKTVAKKQKPNTIDHISLIKKYGESIAIKAIAVPLADASSAIVGGVVVLRNVDQERAVEQAKDTFLSIASHNLRTPLSTINWYAEMLLSGDAGQLNVHQGQYVKEMYVSSQHMVGLVNALLNVSRLEAGSIQIEKELVSFVEVFRASLNDFTKQLREKRLHLAIIDIEKLPKIRTDEKIFGMVIQNLVSNAIKYTPADGSIVVEGKNEKANVVFSVKDTGCGIPIIQQPQMFGRLFRADNVKMKQIEGVGLGLYTTKLLVEALGGRIWFESKEQIGTTFFVSLPKKSTPV